MPVVPTRRRARIGSYRVYTQLGSSAAKMDYAFLPAFILGAFGHALVCPAVLVCTAVWLYFSAHTRLLVCVRAAPAQDRARHRDCQGRRPVQAPPQGA
jgi:hypothetical protein